MSTDVYAGQLCATHVNEWITHPTLDPRYQWWTAEIRHSERHHEVRVICKGIDYTLPTVNRRGGLPKTVQILVLQPDEIVTFSVR